MEDNFIICHQYTVTYKSKDGQSIFTREFLGDAAFRYGKKFVEKRKADGRFISLEVKDLKLIPSSGIN